ncbi:uncharacterized protein LOC128883785 isoform X2 [Hylaeus volcanicus]|uniref:uncharacterized protein LOC128883785 isoform X2 n=1 Tax=Hylaeus volcanicus TaxID=313075 RepID=UPI0023B7F0FF|nr:uncharacterized protein LOC128883785 isoform X2 [Hylaeus volcanicus]
MQKSRCFQPVGCSYAAQQAWNAQTRQSGLKKAFIYNAEPCSAYDCWYRLYDITQTAFISMVFNQTGTLLVAMTANSFLRFIGLKTMCIYASIYMCDYFDEGKENIPLTPHHCSETSGTIFMNFLDHDSKLAVKWSESLLIFSLTDSPSIHCLMKINLLAMFHQLNHKTLSFCRTQVLQFEKSSEADTFSKSSPISINSQVFAQQLREDITFVGSYQLSNDFQKTTDICDHLKSVLYIEQCQILQHFNSVFDFFITSEPSISIPMRMIWDFQKKTLMSAEVLLPIESFESPIKIKSQLRCSIVFATCNFGWHFCYDKKNFSKILKYNSAIEAANFNKEAETYSLWNESIHLHANEQHVFCAVVQGSSEFFLHYLFKDYKIPSQTVASIKLKNSLSASTQLVVNKSGSLLLCRSANCLTLMRLSVDQRENEENKDESLTFSKSKDGIPKVKVQVVLCYQKPIPRDRLTFCAISNAPCHVNVILLFYGKSNSTVQFLRFNEKKGSIEVNKSLQLSNCKELDQYGSPVHFNGRPFRKGKDVYFFLVFRKEKKRGI